MDSLILKNNINSLITDRIIKDGDIPRWLLVEVLIRLPQKSVFRCKLVSKEWLSIILDPYFVRFYCSRALQFWQRWALFGSIMCLNSSERLHFLGYDDSSKPASCFYPLPRDLYGQQDQMYKIYGVSNGLVLYKFMVEGFYSYTTIFRICNPATGQWLALPPHQYAYDTAGQGFVANVEDGVLLSFTVVRMYEVCVQTKLTKCQVYFSEIGEWQMYDVHIDIPIPILFKSSRSSTVLNGIIYWIPHENVLIAYDPRKSPDQAHIIALPETCYNSSSICSAYQGQLRYFNVSYNSNESPFSSFRIWVMNKGDWCLQHRVSHVDIIQPCDIISGRSLRLNLSLGPMSFHPYDSDIVYLEYIRMVFSYNIKSRKLEVAEDFRQTYIESAIRHTELFSIEIPPWPISRCHPSIRD